MSAFARCLKMRLVEIRLYTPIWLIARRHLLGARLRQRTVLKSVAMQTMRLSGQGVITGGQNGKLLYPSADLRCGNRCHYGARRGYLRLSAADLPASRDRPATGRRNRYLSWRERAGGRRPGDEDTRATDQRRYRLDIHGVAAFERRP